MIIILMGVSGSGKTTIGEGLAQALGWPFSVGDRQEVWQRPTASGKPRPDSYTPVRSKTDLARCAPMATNSTLR